jgi:hypothetical protein
VLCVVVDESREDEPTQGRRRRFGQPLAAPVGGPAEVHRPRRPSPEDVHLLPRVGPDIADVEVAGRAVEREAPGVAEPVGDDLRLRRAAADVDPDELAEQASGILRRRLRVPVADPDVEEAVRSELELTAVVVVAALGRNEHVEELTHPSAAGAVLDHVEVAVAADVVDVEPSAAAVVGREREREKPGELLVEYEPAEVEEGPRQQTSAGDDADEPALLEDVEPARLAARRGDVDGRAKPAGDRHELWSSRRAGGDGNHPGEDRPEDQASRAQTQILRHTP